MLRIADSFVPAPSASLRAGSSKTAKDEAPTFGFDQEKSKTTGRAPGRLVLADAHAWKGNSGSLMFVSMPGFRRGSVAPDGVPYRLLGVVSGYWSEESNFNLRPATTLLGTVRANSGISLIVPADELKNLLDGIESKRKAHSVAAGHQSHVSFLKLAEVIRSRRNESPRFAHLSSQWSRSATETVMPS